MFNNNNNNYGSNGVPEYMAYGGVPVGFPKGVVPENATNGAIPQWAIGQQNNQSINLVQNNLQMDNNTINFDDIYYSTIDKNGNVLYKGTSSNEGEFSKGTDIKGATVISPNLATSINLLNSNETSQFNDLLSQKRMSRYFDSVDRNPQKNINNLKGWYNRAKSYYSIPQEFEKLYKNKVDYYILNKYPQFYNGK